MRLLCAIVLLVVCAFPFAGAAFDWQVFDWNLNHPKYDLVMSLFQRGAGVIAILVYALYVFWPILTEELGAEEDSRTKPT